MSEPTVVDLQPTPVRGGGPPTRAAVAVLAIGFIAVVGFGVVGRAPKPSPPAPTALASIAAVATPSATPSPVPTPTPAPTLRTGGCTTGLPPIVGGIPRQPRPLQPPPLVAVSAAGGVVYQAVASEDAFWTLGQGRLTRFDATGRTTGQWDYLDDPTFGAYSISAAQGGGVWLWGYDDIRWFDGAGFADSIPLPAWALPGNVAAVAEAPDGSVWATTYQGGTGRWDGRAWTLLCTDADGPDDGSSKLAFAPDGTVWVMRSADLVHYDSTGATLGSVAIPSTGRYGTEAMAVAADGSVWVASPELVQRFDGQWTTVHGPGTQPIGAAVLAAAADGSVWAATGSAGGDCCADVARFDGTDTRMFTSSEGIGAAPGSGLGIGAIAVRDGAVVVATTLGTYRLPADASKPGWWARFGSPPNDLPDPTSISLMVVDGSDRLLAAVWDRLWEVRGGDWRAVDLPGLPPGFGSIDGMARAADGTVGLATSVGAIVRTDGTWTVLDARGTMAIAFDESGACWLAPGGSDPNTGNTLQEHALYRFTRHGTRWARSTVAVPAEVSSIESLTVGPDGDVWLRGMLGDVPSLWQRHGKRWTRLPALPSSDAYWSGRRMAVTAAGDLVTPAGGNQADPPLIAYRYDGKAWSPVHALGGVASYGGNDLAVAADGTIWVTAGGSGLTRTGGPDGDLQLPGSFGAVALDASGTAYVAGPSGIYRVRR